MPTVLFHLVCAVVASLACAPGVSAQTFTNIISGENSEKFSFINSASSRSTVTSIQSPFGYPGNHVGAPDTLPYPSGNSSATPAW